jgi:benzoate-CoA ligase
VETVGERVAVPERFNAARFFVDRHIDEGRGNRPAIRVDGSRLTYGDIHRSVNQVGNALLNLGVERGDRVLLALLDGPEFVASFFGAMKIGAVPVPVNTLMRSADYQYFLSDSAAKVLVVSEPLWTEVGAVVASASQLSHVVVAGSAPASHVSYDEWVADASASLECVDTSKDDPAFWLYSSGSTGFPKGAVHRHRDMLVCSDTYALQVLGITEADVTFSAAKLFFAYGLGNNLYFPMRVGAEAVFLAGRPSAEVVFEILDRERPTLFFGVPTLYAGMLQVKDGDSRFDLSSLRRCVSAGEALPADVYRRWMDRFHVEILDGIGTTEVLHIFLSNRPGLVRPGSSGVPVPGYDVVVVDEAGKLVPRGEIGNLRVKGDSTMACYWNRPDKTSEVLDGPWIATGDKYYVDEDGFFWYCGRVDDMLKVGGIWVSPIEVESALIAHDAVLEAAVVGHLDADRLIKPKAFVVLKDPGSASEGLAEELREFVRARIAPYKRPWWIEFVSVLPKTATGKIQRYKLREAAPSDHALP